MNTTNSLWNFSLKIYAQPGVAEQCLALQDDFGVDVNLLLWSLWLEQCGQKLSPELLTLAKTHVADWSQQAVQPLRAIRRELKMRFGVEDSDREAVRQVIKAAELKAEQYQQQRLQQLLPISSLPPLAVGDNCRVYLLSCQVPLELINAFIQLMSKLPLPI